MSARWRPVALGIAAAVATGICPDVSDAELDLRSYTDNPSVQFVLGRPGVRIFGDLDGIAVARASGDTAPAGAPTAILLDAYDSRILVRYFEPLANGFGFHEFTGLSHPHGLAFRSDGNVYVADTGANRIVKFRYLPGTGYVDYVSAFGSSGVGEVRFKEPLQLALDRNGNLYVVDSLNCSIKVFDPSGNPVRSFVRRSRSPENATTNTLGSYGVKEGQFAIPSAVTVSYVDGSIYVADTGTSRIQRFNADGSFSKMITGLPSVGAITINGLESDLLGRIYVADTARNVLYILDADLNYLDESHGPPGAPFRKLHAVAVDKSLDAGGKWHSLAQVHTAEAMRFCIFTFPDLLIAEGADGQVLLNWNHADLPPSGISGYYVYRSAAEAGPYARIATLMGRGNTVYADSDAGNGMVYYYKVSILTSAGFESSPVGPAVVVPYPGPTAPTRVAAYALPGAVRVTWLPSSPTANPVAGYDILRATIIDATHPGEGQFVPIGRVESSSTGIFVDNTVDSANTYAYVVRGRDATGRLGPTSSPPAPARPSVSLDWPLFRRDTSQRGITPDQVVAVPPSRMWGTIVGLDVAVVVKDARVFETTTQSITALDLYSGTTLWTFGSTPSGPTNRISVPAAGGNLVYFYSDWAVRAFDAAVGQGRKDAVERWRFSPVSVNTRQVSNFASPPYFTREGVTLANEVVYAGFAGQAFALDANTGALKWSLRLPGVSVSEYIAPPAVTGDTAYFLSSGGRLAAIGTGDYDIARRAGVLRYAKDLALSSPGSAALTYSNGVILIPSRSILLAIEAVTGKLLWSVNDMPAEYQAEVAVNGDDVYAVTRQDALLRCFSASTGTRKWSFPLVGTENIIAADSVTAPALDGAHIFYAANLRFRGSPAYQGRLVAVTPPSPVGSPVPSLAFLGREDLGPIDVSPVIAEKTVLVGGVAYGRLAAVKLDLSVPATVVRNQPFPLTIRALNAGNEVDTEYTGTVQLTCTDPAAHFGGTVIFSSLDKGVKVLGRILTQVGSVTIRAQDTVRTLLAGSVTVQVMPTTGIVKRLVLTAPADSQAGMGFRFTVKAVDLAGNVVDTYRGTVEFTSTDPAGLLPPRYTFTKTDAGVHAFSATLFSVGYRIVRAREVATPAGVTGQATVRVYAGQEFIALEGVRAYYDMDFLGSQNGWIVGASLADATAPLFVRNTGAGWAPEAAPVLPACTIFVDAVGVSVGSADSAWAEVEGIRCEESEAEGFLYQQLGGVWQAPVATPPLQIPVLHGIALTNMSDGWLSLLSCFYCSGYRNHVIRYDGSQWVPFTVLPEGVVLNDFRFVRGQPGEGWAKASGVPSGLYHFKDGIWAPDTSFPFQFGLLGLWMNSPTDLWGGGFGQVLVHYDGVSWTLVDNPAPYGATFNAMHFFDGNHGVAVGSKTGSVDQGHPVIEYFADGAWYDIPVVLPPNLITLGLNGVRMVSRTEAWAYGAGFDIQTGNLEEPRIVHIHLPTEPPQPPATMMAPALRVQGAPAVTGGSFRIVGFSTSPSGRAPVALSVSVNEPCGATLTIYSAAMRPVATVRFAIVGTTYGYTWDGHDAGTGLPATPGWYSAVLDASSASGKAQRIITFPILGPGQPTVPIASTAGREMR